MSAAAAGRAVHLSTESCEIAMNVKVALGPRRERRSRWEGPRHSEVERRQTRQNLPAFPLGGRGLRRRSVNTMSVAGPQILQKFWNFGVRSALDSESGVLCVQRCCFDRYTPEKVA